MIMTNGHRLLVNVGTYKYIIIYCFKVKLISVWTPRIVWYPIIDPDCVFQLDTIGLRTMEESRPSDSFPCCDYACDLSYIIL